VLSDPPLFASNPLLGWAIIALAVIVGAWIMLKLVGKAIKASIRIAIAVAVLALIATGLCWLSSALGGVPFS
jgi:hypothetical protein